MVLEAIVLAGCSEGSKSGTGPPPDVAVFTAEIKQGLAVVDFSFQDFSDKNSVIAGEMRSYNFAAQLE